MTPYSNVVLRGTAPLTQLSGLGKPVRGGVPRVRTAIGEADDNLALEYFYTTRGMMGRMPGQAIERKHAGRISWSLPIEGDLDARLTCGYENISNLNLAGGIDRTSQLALFELRYRY